MFGTGTRESATAHAWDAAVRSWTPQEHLGLKLDSSRGPVRMLGIDRVKRPVED